MSMAASWPSNCAANCVLKGDEETAGELTRRLAPSRWRYTHNKTGKDVAMPYWTVPDAALTIPTKRQKWVRLAWDAALRAK